MDTPERSKAVATPLSKSEDSPVFNFLNNLSPIQPVKSVHTAQTFHSLTFASISSIFASPHVNPQRESRFLIRNSIPDFGKHEASSGNDEDVNLQVAGPNAVKSSSCAALASESCAITCSLNEATAEPPDESLSLPNNLPQAVQYDCGSPNHNTTPCYAIRPDLKLDIGGKSVQLVQFVQDGLDKRKNLFTTEIELQGKAQLEKVKEEMPGCDWEALISDEAGDLLIFDSSTESKAREGPDGMPADNYTATSASLSLKPAEDVSGLQKTQSDAICGPFFENTEDPHDNLHGEIMEQYETDHTPQILTISCHNQAATGDENQNLGNGSSDCISPSCKVDSQQQRGARRRCLVFEVAGLSRKNMHKESSHLPSLSLPSNKNFSSDDTQSVSLKIGTSPSPRVLPGIGLHLNALATTSKDRMVTQDTLPSGRRLISMPCSIGPFHTTTSGQKILDKSLAVENTLGHPTTELQDLQVELYDDSQGPSFKSCEDMSQSSPKKKKRKSENGNEGEACKRCNCKKSKCLKLYCECFAAGVYCVEPCSCQGCFNKPVHEETVLATRKQIESRNPLAFAPKVIRVPEPVQDIRDENNKTPASARHKRGCNCKKSSCLKKYCECYQGGVGCSISCRCEGCKNAFGRKDGYEECEQEGEEMAVCENEGEKPDGSQQNVDVQMDERNSPENTLAITPFQICRSSAKQPFISSGKPPRSSTFPIGYSPRLNISQALRKCQIPLPQRKSEKHVKTATEDDTPEILRGNASPSSGVKTASPNRKRVSPPHNGIAFSPNHKGSRKLILKSIPSFPSLSSEVISEYQMSYPMSSYNSG